MALPAVVPHPLSPQVIGNAFVQQYYEILHRSPELVHRFYQDSSILSRPDSDGIMSSVTTMKAINEKILSSDSKAYVAEIETLDSQSSYKDGVFIVVTGCLTGKDLVRRKFTHSFFLAPQDNGGYFVLNDIFRFVEVVQPREDSHMLVNGTGDDDQKASLSPEPDSDLVEEAHSVNLTKVPDGGDDKAEEVTDKAEEVSIPSEAGGSGVEDKVVGGSGVEDKVVGGSGVEDKVVDVPSKTANPSQPNALPLAITQKDAPKKSADGTASITQKDAPKKSADGTASITQKDAPKKSANGTASITQKDAPKKSYASIVKVMKGNLTPVPVHVPSTKAAKAPANPEKLVTLPTKPAPIPETPVPNINIALDNNNSHEEGYSIYIRNLPLNATVEQVEEQFKKFGPIKHGGVQVRSQKSPFDRFCFGFAEFDSLDSMHAAIEASPIDVGGRPAYIEEKRTTTRVINGVVTNVGRGRFPTGRGGFRNDGFRGRENPRGSNQGYGRSELMNKQDGSDYDRGGFRNDGFRGRENPRGSNQGYGRSELMNKQDGSDYDGEGWSWIPPAGNGYHRRVMQNGNGRMGRGNGDGTHHSMGRGNGIHQSAAVPA